MGLADGLCGQGFSWDTWPVSYNWLDLGLTLCKGQYCEPEEALYDDVGRHLTAILPDSAAAGKDCDCR